MTDPSVQHLSADEVTALRFAAHRQLTRWANKRQLEPLERARRTALISALRALRHNAYDGGCLLRAPDRA